jgi:hypothetical protein
VSMAASVPPARIEDPLPNDASNARTALKRRSRGPAGPAHKGEGEVSQPHKGAGTPVLQRALADGAPAAESATGSPASDSGEAGPFVETVRPLVGEHAMATAVEPIPPTVAARIEQATGVDVSATPVHRGEPVAATAAALSARAFTMEREVYLAGAQGSLQSPSGQSLLAHELTHVAQQRRLGSSLPDERSAAGQGLEREAREMEASFASTPPLPLRGRDFANGGIELAEPSAPPAQQVERVQKAEAVATPGSSLGTDPPPSASPTRGEGHWDERDLEDLARKLYERIRGRLRQELLVDRERAGMLSDWR